MSGHACSECHWHGDTPTRLVLYSTMGELFHLVVCPECRHIESSLVLCCDEPGCREYVDQGFPTPDGGYRQTCHLHGQMTTRTSCPMPSPLLTDDTLLGEALVREPNKEPTP
jgi:hypothetical protein